MDFHKNTYRESLLKWCKDIEKTWKSIRGKLTNVDEQKLKHWEDNFFALKKEAEMENSTHDYDELHRKSTSLYDELNGFLNRPKWISDQKEDEKIQTVPIGGHRLPPLPYPYDALEPVISEEIMKLHHDKHHQSYVDGLNKAEAEMKKARDKGDFHLIAHWEREAAFHGSGHYLHTIFWNVMSPRGGGKPAGQLSRAINEAFGSFEKFKKHFSEAAKKVEAVGWAILVWAPRSHRLEILTAEKHQNLTQWDVIPLLVLDVWEHAYYLQYKNDRAKYVDNWWKIVNWREVEQRFNKAKTIMWQPF
ncbi:superoxide dismutase [Domibacillus epiphyticus]|uniref:superoxide dismutase n=1 Tax=Domibacillus epiphyticus TaxID=1714355 RepID=A0A1V2A5P7_9BACI|nr:superoxide dismutase [Domibacillus epiphyticus]OMP66335.1 superoxide dismutase [Domibacillus epiphyticus]